MSKASSRPPERRTFWRSWILSAVKIWTPLRPREMVTYHCCWFVAAFTAESENST